MGLTRMIFTVPLPSSDGVLNVVIHSPTDFVYSIMIACFMFLSFIDERFLHLFDL
jgi:hypothetical protein